VIWDTGHWFPVCENLWNLWIIWSAKGKGQRAKSKGQRAMSIERLEWRPETGKGYRENWGYRSSSFRSIIFVEKGDGKQSPSALRSLLFENLPCHGTNPHY